MSRAILQANPDASFSVIHQGPWEPVEGSTGKRRISEEWNFKEYSDASAKLDEINAKAKGGKYRRAKNR